MPTIQQPNKGSKKGSDENSSSPNKWSRVLFIVTSFLIVVFTIISYLFYKSSQQFNPMEMSKLSEVIYEIESKQNLQIKDSNVIKAIALDSLEFINQIEQPASEIEVNKSEFLEQLAFMQSSKLEEFRDYESTFDGLKYNYRPRITSKSFIPLRFLAGVKDVPLSATEVTFLTNHYTAPSKFPFLSFGGVKLNPTDRKMDIRAFGISSTPFDQILDPTCWAIAATKAFDISYQISNKKSIISSQQQPIDCSGGGDGDGGLSYKVFQWMEDRGILLCDSSVYPYVGTLQNCRSNMPKSYALANWSLLNRNNPGLPATIESIKDAICRFGCVVSSVKATEKWRDYRTDEVFVDRNTYRRADNSLSSDHSVLIIGWDDEKQAWLIKNSWGEDWGNTGGRGNQYGYMWLNYSSCNIGLMAVWVLAR